MNHIRSLELRIEENNKIMSKYLEEANNIMNYKNLLNFSISIEDIYEDKLNELLLCVNEITDLYHIRVKELKNNYLNDFNKRYNFHIVDQGNIGFRHSDLLNLRLDQIKFNELCRINFKNIVELELKFEDDIDITVLTKASYNNLYLLGLYGKIKDTKPLSKFPFKNLNELRIENNSYNTNIDIFRNAPFNKLQILVLEYNNINNISGLTKAPFYELTHLNLANNLIYDIRPIVQFPFKKLKHLLLDYNHIEDLKYISEAPFYNLKALSLCGNNLSDITIFSKVNFFELQSLYLDNNQISNIQVFSQVPFTNLRELSLRENKIININVFKNVPFINLSTLKLSKNKIKNFEALIISSFINRPNIYLDKYQQHNIANQKILSNINQKFNLISD